METTNTQPEPKPVEKKPDETGGYCFSSFVKITDTETGAVLVQTRGDN